jgi:uroporphyrinogen-III synthase
MNTRGKVTAAAASIALNVALVLGMSQGAPAAAADASQAPAETRTVIVYRSGSHDEMQEHCEARLRTRALVAVILAMIV